MQHAHIYLLWCISRLMRLKENGSLKRQTYISSKLSDDNMP
jgi:hypothetical protein